MTKKTVLISLTLAFALSAPVHAKALSKQEQQLVELSKALHKRLGAVEQMILKGVQTRDISLLKKADDIAQDASLQFAEKRRCMIMTMAPTRFWLRRVKSVLE